MSFRLQRPRPPVHLNMLFHLHPSHVLTLLSLSCLNAIIPLLFFSGTALVSVGRMLLPNDLSWVWKHAY